MRRGDCYEDIGGHLWTVVDVYTDGRIAICGQEGLTIKPVSVEILTGWKELK